MPFLKRVFVVGLVFSTELVWPGFASPRPVGCLQDPYVCGWEYVDRKPQLIGVSKDGRSYVLRWVCVDHDNSNMDCDYPTVGGLEHCGVVLLLNSQGKKSLWIVYQSQGACTSHKTARRELSQAKEAISKAGVSLKAQAATKLPLIEDRNSKARRKPNRRFKIPASPKTSAN